MVCDTISEMKKNEGDIQSKKPGDQPTVSCRCCRCRCRCRCIVNIVVVIVVAPRPQPHFQPQTTSPTPNHIPTPNPQGLTWDEVGVSVNQWAPKESETQAVSATGDIKSAQVSNDSATRQMTPVITRKQKVSARLC